MNEIAFIVGIGLVGLLLMYFANSLKEEHKLLKLFIHLMVITFLILVPKVMIDNNDYCEILANETITQDNVTTFDYTRVCFNNPNSTTTAFFKGMNWILISFALYIFIYLTYIIFTKLSEEVKQRKW